MFPLELTFSVRLPRRWFTWWIAVCCLSVLVCTPAVALAVEISDPQWGFDGRVRPDRFNLLTVTLDNPSLDTVTFDLVLQKTFGAGPVDAPVVQRIAMGPGSRRIAQMYPYISSEYGSWQLSGDRTKLDIPQPRARFRGARVLLDPSDQILGGQGSLKRFPAGQFPPFVTATDTLEAVVLDHVPTWEEPRRQAFLDWLYQGGAVFLLQGPSGQYPEFSGALQVLNTPLERGTYGSGVIHKTELSRRDLSSAAVKALWTRVPNRAPPVIDPNVESGLTARPVDDDDDDENSDKQPFNYSDGSSSVRSRAILEALTKMTKPDHNWWLLHGMFWVYILLIFPGCYIIGQQRNDLRIVYVALIGIVFVFSLAFGIVGRRGYGETTTIHSVSIVQPLPDGQLDVAQWSNAFVTSGAMYDMTHLGTGVLYSTCQESEPVRGLIVNGNEPMFRVDIPPFSSREFAHRAKMPGTLPAATVKEFAPGPNGLSKLTIQVADDFPQAEEMYLLARDRFYSVARKGNEITLRSSIGTIPAFLRLDQNQNYYPQFGGMYGQDDRTQEARYRELVIPLIARSLNLRTQADAEAIRWSPDRVRLMYVADMLPELHVQNPKFTSQTGKTLYCLDLALPQGTP